MIQTLTFIGKVPSTLLYYYKKKNSTTLYSCCHLHFIGGKIEAQGILNDLSKITLPIAALAKINPGLANLNVCCQLQLYISLVLFYLR